LCPYVRRRSGRVGGFLCVLQRRESEPRQEQRPCDAAEYHHLQEPFEGLLIALGLLAEPDGGTLRAAAAASPVPRAGDARHPRWTTLALRHWHTWQCRQGVRGSWRPNDAAAAAARAAAPELGWDNWGSASRGVV